MIFYIGANEFALASKQQPASAAETEKTRRDAAEIERLLAENAKLLEQREELKNR